MTDTRYTRIYTDPAMIARMKRIQAAHLMQYGSDITHRDLVEQIVEQYETRLGIKPPTTGKEDK